MKHVLLSTFVLISAAAIAKLPAPDDAAKAKAAEAAAKQAWQAKVDAYQLCKAQDKVAAVYKKSAGKVAGKDEAKPASASASNAPASTQDAKAAPPSAAASAVAQAAAQPASGTPVSAAPPPPCADPGPFAYNAPAQTPLETSGAHSPGGTAVNPPSVKPNSAEMAPSK